MLHFHYFRISFISRTNIRNFIKLHGLLYLKLKRLGLDVNPTTVVVSMPLLSPFSRQLNRMKGISLNSIFPSPHNIHCCKLRFNVNRLKVSAAKIIFLRQQYLKKGLIFFSLWLQTLYFIQKIFLSRTQHTSSY